MASIGSSYLGSTKYQGEQLSKALATKVFIKYKLFNLDYNQIYKGI